MILQENVLGIILLNNAADMDKILVLMVHKVLSSKNNRVHLLHNGLPDILNYIRNTMIR